MIEQETKRQAWLEKQKKKVLSSDGLVVAAGYKCGTTTLEKNFKCFKTHDMPQVIENVFNKEIYDLMRVLLIPFRVKNEVYPSALFQDIVDLAYIYCPFKKGGFLDHLSHLSEEERKDIVLKIPVEKLYDHYKTIDWDHYTHLNNKLRLDKLNEYYGVKADYNSKEIQVFHVESNEKTPKKLIVFNSNLINEKFYDLQKEVWGEVRVSGLPKNHNVGKTKWYQSKYDEFVSYLKKREA